MKLIDAEKLLKDIEKTDLEFMQQSDLIECLQEIINKQHTISKTVKNKNVYILERQDDWGYDEYIEQTIVTETEERALELANKQYGVWAITRKVDLNIEQILTKNSNDG